MEKIILTDADGCLVDWDTGFNKFITEKGYPRINGTTTEYNISIRHGITGAQAQEFVKEFNEGPCIEDLKPLADSVEYVGRLVADGFRFIVVTSLSDAPWAFMHRTKNLTNIFGNIFDDIHCISLGSSKAHILKRWSDTGYFWIEDHMRQAEAGYEAGLRTVLINHPYNYHYSTDLFPTVNYQKPWEEIYYMISDFYKNLNK